MAHELKFDHPHFPEGTVFSISGLPEVENGQTIGIDEDAERFFVSNTGLTVEDAFADDPTVDVSGSSELSNDEVEQLIGDNRGTDEELGRTGGDEVVVPEVVVPDNPVFFAENKEGGELDA